MSWRTVFIKDGEYLKLKLDNIVILKEEYEFIIPLSDISIIIVEGLQTTLTTRLLNALSSYNISLVICNHEHTPSGIFHNYNGHSRASKMLKKQIEWNSSTKGIIWQNIIKQKIRNQCDLLAITKSDNNAIDKLKQYQKETELYDQTNREGHSAKVYFNALFGKSFTRQDDDNIINAGLNYGYAVIRAQLTRLVVAYGLIPMLGVFHKSEYNQFNLVDDLIEPFRPFVDSWVYFNMKEADFLTYNHRAELINLLNVKAVYNNQNQTLGVILEKYVIEFIQFMNTGDYGKLNNPIIKTFEVIRNEL
jgi:CRISPR-associated endonuclease Cas1